MTTSRLGAEGRVGRTTIPRPRLNETWALCGGGQGATHDFFSGFTKALHGKGFFFVLSFFFLALGTEHLGATALYSTHTPPLFSFSFAVNSSHHHHFFTLWGEYMGNDMEHTWHDTRRFYTGEGAGYIQPGNWGEGGRTTSREVSSHPSVFFFGLDSLLQNLAGLETVLWLFSFSLLGVMSFLLFIIITHAWVSLSLSLSLTHVSHSRLLVVLPSRRLFLLVDTHAEHVSTMCAERDGRDDDLCPWMDDGWTRGCTEQDGLVSRLRRPMDDDDEDKVERWMDDLEQRWTSW